MKRTLWRGFLGIATLMILGGVWWLSTSVPDETGTFKVDGLESRVDVLRDAQGVPHIYARSEEDAAFALGFVHAQDRLWQMEAMRRLGAGRLAEIIGSSALPSDRFMRVLSLYHLAEDQVAHLDGAVQRTLNAYAAGVNAWLKGRRGALPPEFLLLGFEPEPWRPADSLVWAKIMALRLSGNFRDELLRARLAGRLPPQQIAEFWPPYPADGPVTVSRFHKLTDIYRTLPLDQLAAADPEPGAMPRGASNAWAVAGSRTASGKPILANDPHLGFSAPVIWYLAHIVTPSLELTGATVPGVPFTILGHNRRIAWGFTSTESDLQDLFLERLDPTDENRYLTPGGPRIFVTRKEVIHVRNGDDVVLTVRESRHGPVISDLLPAAPRHGGNGPVMALAATFLRGGDLTPQAMYRLNRAGTWQAFVAAIKDFDAPQQNIVYADTDGNIGFYAPGWVPIRRNGNGRFPTPGWTGEGDWTGFVPFESLPNALNPLDGKVVTANNKVVPDAYPYFITDDWAPPYRARRIVERLDASARQSMTGTGGIQLDSLSLMARSLLPLMLAVQPAGDKEKRATALLRSWDHVMSRARPEPLIFAAWLRELDRAIYADELGALFYSHWTFRPRFVASVLRTNHVWCDDVTTEKVEDCPSRIELSLTRALNGLSSRFGDDMSAWRWGDAHRARFRHRITSALPVIGGIADLVIPTDGGDQTVNRGAMRIAGKDHPFEDIHGAGLRAIYDLANLDHSRFMIATGQSGNPLSRHYGDLLEGWRDGRTMVLGRPRQEIVVAGATTMMLIPK